MALLEIQSTKYFKDSLALSIYQSGIDDDSIFDYLSHAEPLILNPSIPLAMEMLVFLALPKSASFFLKKQILHKAYHNTFFSQKFFQRLLFMSNESHNVYQKLVKEHFDPNRSTHPGFFYFDIVKEVSTPDIFELFKEPTIQNFLYSFLESAIEQDPLFASELGHIIKLQFGSTSFASLPDPLLFYSMNLLANNQEPFWEIARRVNYYPKYMDDNQLNFFAIPEVASDLFKHGTEWIHQIIDIPALSTARPELFI